MKHKIISILFLFLAPVIACAQDARLSAKVLSNTTALVPGQSHVLLVQVSIKKDFHAQSNTPLGDSLIPFEVNIDPNASLSFGKTLFPTPVIHDYPQLGKISVFEDTFPVFIPVSVKADAKLQNTRIRMILSYQICDNKTCFRPNKTTLTLDIPIADKAEPANADLFKDYAPPATQPSSASFTPPTPDTSKSIYYYFGIAFLAGLIFNVMPCVLPVLPLKILGFHEAASHDRAKTILFGACFCAGVIAVFAVLGLFVVVLNYIQWGQLFSNLYFTLGIVALLLFLSIGLFTPRGLSLPGFFYSLSPSHETLSGNLVWGSLTAILSTSCTAPFFPLLMSAASTQSKPISLALMATVGFGMGFPYLVLSAFPEIARKFPRTGPLGNLVKQMLGFSLVAIAAYFAAGYFVPAPKHWYWLIPVAGAACVFLIVRTLMITRKPLALALSFIIAISMPAGSYAIAKLFNTSKVNWIAFTDPEFTKARQTPQPVLVEFTASWCLNCQYVEATVFKDERVLELLNRKKVIVFKADITNDSAPGNAFLKGITPTGGIPATAIYPPKEFTPIFIEGVYTAETLIKVLESL